MIAISKTVAFAKKEMPNRTRVPMSSAFSGLLIRKLEHQLLTLSTLAAWLIEKHSRKWLYSLEILALKYQVLFLTGDSAVTMSPIIQMLEKCGCSYVVMLKSDTYGHTQMTRKHAANIKWNGKYAVSDDGKFGNTENGRLFGSHPDTAWINLYYDGANGMDRSIALIRKIRTVTREANKSILNHEKPSIPRELSSYLSARKNGQSWELFYD